MRMPNVMFRRAARPLACCAGFLALAACTTVPPTTTPPAVTPSPTMHVHVHVRGLFNEGIGGAAVRLHTALGWVSATTAGSDGYAMLTVEASLRDTQLQVVPPSGWQAVDRHETVSADATLLVQLQPVPLPRLRADGRVFRLPDGTIWRYRGLTAFTLLKRYLSGEDVRPFLVWARELGANTLRVLCRVAWGELDPRTVPEFDARLGAFLTLAESYGLRVELVVLADCRTDGHNVVPAAYWLDDDGQRALLLQVGAVAAQHTNALIEWGNEYSVNGWDPGVRADRLPVDVLQSRGSGGADGAPARPALDYGTFHAGRTGDWPRKQGKQACEWSYGCGADPEGGPLGVPVVDDEPQKIVAGKADTPADFYQAHALSALFVAGSTIHAQSLLRAEIPTGAELAAVEAAAQAWVDVPSDAPLGRYTRGGSSSCPLAHTDLDVDPVRGALRTFCQIAGSQATCVVVRPGTGHQVLAQGGWRVVSANTRGLVFLAR